MDADSAFQVEYGFTNNFKAVIQLDSLNTELGCVQILRIS